MAAAQRATLPSLGGTLGFGEVVSSPFCTVCKKHFATQSLYDTHLNGHTHKAALSAIATGGLQRGGGLHPQMGQRIADLLEPVQLRQTD